MSVVHKNNSSRPNAEQNEWYSNLNGNLSAIF
jgi:hypothetical protein